jgi:hypothetical protein
VTLPSAVETVIACGGNQVKGLDQGIGAREGVGHPRQETHYHLVRRDDDGRVVAVEKRRSRYRVRISECKQRTIIVTAGDYATHASKRIWRVVAKVRPYPGDEVIADIIVFPTIGFVRSGFEDVNVGKGLIFFVVKSHAIIRTRHESVRAVRVHIGP